MDSSTEKPAVVNGNEYIDKKVESRKDEEDTDTRCGYGRWRPQWLQKGANNKVLLMAICWFTFVQGFVIMGINNVNTTTLERRFDLRSSQVAWITSAYDVASAVLGIIMGYLAGFHHKGRMLTVGAVFMSAGSFVMFLPHLLVGNYGLGNSPPLQECDKYGNASHLDCGSGSSVSNYFYLFILGQISHAVGGVAIYNNGLTFLDDNVKSTDTALYVGIMHTFSALGPAVALIGGGALLGVYVDIGRVDMDDITLTPEDPRWVGAWWIGYILSSVGALTVAFIMACFPRELPETKEIRKHKQSEAYAGAGEKEMARDDFGRSWRDVGLSLKVIFTNLTWIFVTFAATVEGGAINAFATFLPKVLQFQFRLTPGAAALFTGIISVPGACGGQLVGGIIPRCLGLRLKGLLMTMVISSFTAFVLSAGILLRCDMPLIAGVNVHYFNKSYTLDEEAVIHPCNEKCYCTTETYEPLCGHDGVEYFSPCHAGCENVTELNNGHVVYSSCSCIPNVNATTDNDLWDAQAGTCEEDCTLKFSLFILMFLVVMIATFITDTIGHTAIIRCVPEKQRGFAYGIQGCIARVLGGVPFPILMGALFDSSCQIWQEKCGSTGSCWVYETKEMAKRLFIFLLVVKAISGICFLLSFLMYKPPPEVLPSFDVDDILQEKNVRCENTANGTGANIDALVAKTDEQLNERSGTSTNTGTKADKEENQNCSTLALSQTTTEYEENKNDFACESLENDTEKLVRHFFTPTSVDNDISGIINDEVEEESRCTHL